MLLLVAQSEKGEDAVRRSSNGKRSSREKEQSPEENRRKLNHRLEELGRKEGCRLLAGIVAAHRRSSAEEGDVQATNRRWDEAGDGRKKVTSGALGFLVFGLREGGRRREWV